MVCNVEYNQLEPLLIASGHPDGDVNEAGCRASPATSTRSSSTQSWSAVATSQGAIDEFINKYADASRTAFKSATASSV